MNKTLITAYECLIYNDIDRTVDPGRFRSHIYDVELKLARKVLGKDFYNALLAASQEFKNVAQYDQTAVYALDYKVLYRGFVFKSLIADNQGNLPNDSGSWSVVDKFTIQAYQDLWVKFLRSFIATEVFSQAAKLMHVQVKNKGFVKRNDPGTGAAQIDRFEFGDIQRHIQEIADVKYENMNDWINENYEEAVYLDPNGDSYFKDYKGLDCNETVNRPPKRKFYFRNNDRY